MNVTYSLVNNILSTLPIGYYLKRGVEVTLSETSMDSYFDSLNDKVVISYPTLATTFNACETENDIEKMVRCLLYHEISHAMLTPKNIHLTDVRNIFEDERIETICRNYYLDVDFASFVKRINNFNGELPKSDILDDMIWE